MSAAIFVANAETAPGASNLLVPASVQPAQPIPGGSPAGARSEIEARSASVGGLEVGGERLHGVLLRRFYAAHGYEPTWAARQPQAAALVNAVLRAGDHGLDPDLFHAALLRNVAALPPLERELVLSDAFLAFADALARGAVPVEQRMDDEDLTPEPVDVTAVLDTAINSADPAAVIEGLAPHSPAYIGLQRALQAYRTAVGVPDKTTEARLRQVEVNLERLRWLPRNLPSDRVWVNLASAQLVLFRADQPAFTTRVVVGQTDKQTPEFRTTIDSVLFNPPWNVPRSIAETEILPKLSRDPDYLSRHHMIVRSNGAIQQVAGPYSALGRLKFEMTDRFDVYLHDTPEKALFVRDNRRQSHGCVRVQNPRELAALLLQQPMDAIDKGIAQGTTGRRMLPAPMPVFLVYHTAFVDADGAVQFRSDVYDRDGEIWQHLHPVSQAPVAQHEPNALQPRG